MTIRNIIESKSVIWEESKLDGTILRKFKTLSSKLLLSDVIDITKEIINKLN